MTFAFSLFFCSFSINWNYSTKVEPQDFCCKAYLEKYAKRDRHGQIAIWPVNVDEKSGQIPSIPPYRTVRTTIDHNFSGDAAYVIIYHKLADDQFAKLRVGLLDKKRDFVNLRLEKVRPKESMAIFDPSLRTCLHVLFA